MPDKVSKQKDEREIVSLVNRLGQVKAASVLKVSPATLNRWLKVRGYLRVTRYEKVAEQKEAV